MKKLPKEVNVLGTKYKIIYFDNPSEVDTFKKNQLWGQVVFWDRNIRVYKANRNPEDIWITIFHEVLHIIIEELHLNLFPEDTQNVEEEKAVSLISLALGDVLFRNKWVKVKQGEKRGKREKMGRNTNGRKSKII